MYMHLCTFVYAFPPLAKYHFLSLLPLNCYVNTMQGRVTSGIFKR